MASVATKTRAPAANAARAIRSRSYIHVPHNLGERAADIITAFVGSWPFVGIHAGWFLLWIVLRIEPFPFGLLTLLVSLEAIFLSTFVMMSQNRAAQKDHIRDDHEAEEVDLLYTINQQQLEILALLRTNLCPADSAPLAPEAKAIPTRGAATGATPKNPAATVRSRPAQRRK
jgi:uncharacterized membrane protein